MTDTHDTSEFSIAGLLKTAKDAKALLFFFGAVLGGITATSSWFGAQIALPQVVSRLDTTVNRRIDSVGYRVEALSDSVRSDRTDVRQALDLLLRLNCPSTGRPDLIRECRDFTNNRSRRN